jgi:hypothetical protein
VLVSTLLGLFNAIIQAKRHGCSNRNVAKPEDLTWLQKITKRKKKNKALSYYCVHNHYLGLKNNLPFQTWLLHKIKIIFEDALSWYK